MRHRWGFAAGLWVAMTAGAAGAADFPTRPVTLIIPWTAGGSTDGSLRALAEATAKHLGQPVLIDNKPGGSGTMGASLVATMKPDGYTVAQAPLTVFRLPHMVKTNFDPKKDFTYVVHLSGYTSGTVVRKDAPWKSLREVVEYARANPGKVTYGIPGMGTSSHITMERIAMAAGGIKWRPVPFRGGAETNAALLGGHVDIVADSTGWAPLVESGDFRLISIWGAKRAVRWPEVPTLQEQGFDIVSESPYGLVGPKGMDPAVTKVLHDAFKKGLEEPVVVDTIAKFDQVPNYMNTADYTAFALKQIEAEQEMVAVLKLAQQENK